MWFRITDIIVYRADATHLENPVTPGSPMELGLFQRESRSVIHVYKPNKIFPMYYETPGGGRIPMQKWSYQMREFAQERISRLPPQKAVRRLTVFGWLLFLFGFSLIGYAVYETVNLPAQKEAYKQKMEALAIVHTGDVYFGRYRIYKEKGNFAGSEGGFGWFKVMNIENDTYHIAKSVEISKTAKPKEEMNSSDFEQETKAVKAKDLGAYTKQFLSDDGLIEFNLDRKK
jgi:hypothetical protein